MDLESLLKLEGITFINQLSDEELLDSILEGKSFNPDKLRIYIKKEKYFNTIGDMRYFFIIREAEGKYYAMGIDPEFDVVEEEKEIDIEDLRNCYMSLDEFLNKAKYIGYEGILYEINEEGYSRYIILDNGILRLVDQTYLAISPEVFSEEYNDKYEDKAYLMKAIKEQIQEWLGKNRSR